MFLVFSFLVCLSVSPVVKAEEQVVNDNGLETTVEENIQTQESIIQGSTEGETQESQTQESIIQENTEGETQEFQTQESAVDENTDVNEDSTAPSISPKIAPVYYSNVYRVYNPNSGAHHYTKRIEEKNYLVSVGWRYEGVAWKGIVSSTPYPVHRIYNPNSGEHLYTILPTERDRLVKVGWNYEGIAWYCYPSKQNHADFEVYRLFNPNTKGAGSHHYTGNVKEAQGLVKLGWRGEGTAFVVKKP